MKHLLEYLKIVSENRRSTTTMTEPETTAQDTLRDAILAAGMTIGCPWLRCVVAFHAAV